MKLFFLCRNCRFALDVDSKDTVGSVMKRLTDKAYMLLDNTVNTRLVPCYAGSFLQQDWPITDIGIPQGSTIRCYLRRELKPSLYVICNYSQEKLDIREPMNVPQTLVSTLRSLVTEMIGLPLSCYRLISPYNHILIDSHKMGDYLIEEGMTLRLEIIPGYDNFIRAACVGNVRDVLHMLSSNQQERTYQCKIALFIAAHYGRYDLTGAILSMGYSTDEPPGFHPTINWCPDRVHIGHLTTAIHQAAKRDNVNILRLFLLNNPACLTCVDGNNETALEIAKKFKNLDAIQYLKSQVQRTTDTTNNIKPAETPWMKEGRGLRRRYQHYNAEKLFEVKTLTQVGRVITEKDGRTRFTVDANRSRSQTNDNNEDYVVVDDDKGMPKIVKKPQIKSPNKGLSNLHEKINKKNSSSEVDDKRLQEAVVNNYILNTSLNGSFRPNTQRSRTSTSDKVLASTTTEDRVTNHVRPASFHSRSKRENRPISTKLRTNRSQTASEVLHLPILRKNSIDMVDQDNDDDDDNHSVSLMAFTLNDHLISSQSPDAQMRKRNKTTMTSLEKYRGQTCREKAVACMDIATTFKSKPWLKQIQLAVRLNVNTCKRSINSAKYFQLQNAE